MTLTTASGCERKTTCELSTSVVFALARLAKKRQPAAEGYSLRGVGTAEAFRQRDEGELQVAAIVKTMTLALHPDDGRRARVITIL
jgi:hypothetical protein